MDTISPNTDTLILYRNMIFFCCKLQYTSILVYRDTSSKKPIETSWEKEKCWLLAFSPDPLAQTVTYQPWLGSNQKHCGKRRKMSVPSISPLPFIPIPSFIGPGKEAFTKTLWEKERNAG